MKRFQLSGQTGYTLAELLVALAMTGLIMVGVATLYITGQGIYQAGANQAQALQSSRIAMATLEEDLRLAGYGFPSVANQPKITAATPTSITFWADLTNGSTSLTNDVAVGNTILQVTSTAGIKAGDTIYLINGGQFETPTVVSVTATTITINPAAGAAYPRGAQVGRPTLITYTWNPDTQMLDKNAGEGAGLEPVASGIPFFQFSYFGVQGIDNDAPLTPPITSPANIRRIQIQMRVQSIGEQIVMTSDIRPRNIP